LYLSASLDNLAAVAFDMCRSYPLDLVINIIGGCFVWKCRDPILPLTLSFADKSGSSNAVTR